MDHGNGQVFALKTHGFRVPMPQLWSIDISINAAQGFELGECIHYFDRPKVPCMPDLIYLLKMFKNFLIQVAMRV
jgi:hypothetical protein